MRDLKYPGSEVVRVECIVTAFDINPEYYENQSELHTYNNVEQQKIELLNPFHTSICISTSICIAIYIYIYIYICDSAHRKDAPCGN